ncbi:MAG: GTPase Era [Lachnospiraceae bacterium]|nr:GTPase Era [Lachnospiraceae bacterium]
MNLGYAEDGLPLGADGGGRQPRAGFVALIGRPNVGKSTLMNHIMGMKLAITSRKPQTTRKRIRCVYTEERGQIVFLDTPGIHRPKNKLGEFMTDAALSTLKEADAAVWLVEPVNSIGEREKEIAGLIEKAGVPTVLAVNKCDTVKNNVLPPILEKYGQLADFHKVIAISGKHSIGKEELLCALFSLLPYGEPFYDEETVTEETERSLVSELIREQVLRCLSEEVPHGVAVDIESMKEEKKLYRIDATLYCEKESHKGIIIGKGGETLKKIGTGARIEAEKLLDRKVLLKIWVKVRKDWRDDEKQIRAFGYRK